MQISDCTLHTTTTTTTTTTTPASPSLSATLINSSPNSTGTLAIWDSMDIHTPIDNHQHSPRPTPQSAPSSSSSPSGFPFSSFFHFSPHTRFEPPISVAHSEIPRQAQDTVEENPTGSRTTTTDTHTAAISSTPTPTHISHIGSDDILTVLLGGSLPGTNTAGNTEACPGQQWLTADAAIAAAHEVHACALIVFTYTGDMAYFVSKRRPNHPIVAITHRMFLYRRLALLYGVFPVLSTALPQNGHSLDTPMSTEELYLRTQADVSDHGLAAWTCNYTWHPRGQYCCLLCRVPWFMVHGQHCPTL
ncbi:hypothetical protein BASA61_005780 [Batrachochytrium salamandrivorans]|nr:hypothetical protein BASA61_005780 [Batrachochytrium salamandrivorans]